VNGLESERRGLLGLLLDLVSHDTLTRKIGAALTPERSEGVLMGVFMGIPKEQL
jgi:hypothetical protein